MYMYKNVLQNKMEQVHFYDFPDFNVIQQLKRRIICQI